jgi:CheY-like chemotaxis protein
LYDAGADRRHRRLPSSMPTPSKPRVLAVDDIASNLVALDAVLGDNCEVVHAHSGPEAIAILQRDPSIDVILMDVAMPGMDGYQAASEIKKLPGCVEIPLVFLTAVYQEDPHVKRGYEVGGLDYFTKPFDPDLLRLKVDVYASFRLRNKRARAKEQQLRDIEDVVRAGHNLSSVLESVPVGVITVDVGGRLCQVNDEALRLLKAVGAVDGDPYGEVLDWWRRNEGTVLHGRSPLTRTLERGESFRNLPVRMVCLNGSTKNLLESTSPLRGLDGAITGAVVVLQDVTEHRKSEADFQQRVARLVQVGMESAGPAEG